MDKSLLAGTVTHTSNGENYVDRMLKTIVSASGVTTVSVSEVKNWEIGDLVLLTHNLIEIGRSEMLVYLQHNGKRHSCFGSGNQDDEEGE